MKVEKYVTGEEFEQFTKVLFSNLPKMLRKVLKIGIMFSFNETFPISSKECKVLDNRGRI